MDADRHSPIDPGRRGFLTLWCFLLGLALLPIPAHLALPGEFLHLMLAPRPPTISDGSILAGYVLFLAPAIPLIPLFLAWSLPGVGRPGLPKRSTVVLCLLVAYHPFRLHFESYDYGTSITKAVAEISREFPLIWTFRHLDTLMLIGLAVWAMLRRHTLRPKEKILFHWGLFACALWAASPLSNDYFDFVFAFWPYRRLSS